MQDLKKYYFSLSTDISSDKFGEKYFPLMATNFKEDKIENKLITLPKLGSDVTGKTLYDLVKESLFSGKDANLIEKHFMGIATDRGPNMLAVRSGLGNRLEQDYPYSISVHDYCHIFNLVCEYSLQAFPHHVLNIVNKISSHFNMSPQRRAIFREVQRDQGAGKNEIREVLLYLSTRWFSLNTSLQRILDLWEYLKVYFEQEGYKDLHDLLSLENELSLRILASLSEKLSF